VVAGSNEEESIATIEPTGEGKGSSGTPENAVGLLLKPRTLVVNYTPTMWMARRAAIAEWGIPSDIPFDDFIDVILDKFFEDRGIKFGGYIVMSKKGGDD
jgi:hypothetical protein